MKMVLFASLTCLTLGFFLGRLKEGGSELPEKKYLVQSERRIDARPSPRTKSGERYPISDEVKSLIGKVGLFPDSELGVARLHAWILQLELNEIPEALEIFLERNRRGDTEEISAEMMTLLTRWYELEGGRVLAWIRAREEWDEEEVAKAEATMIVDGFERDPQRSLELALELIDRSRDDDEFAQLWTPGRGFVEEVLYEIGSWGADPIKMLGLLDPEGDLRKVYHSSGWMPHPDSKGSSLLVVGVGNGFPEHPSDWSDFSRSSEMEALARGLLHSGRAELARQFLTELEGGARDAFDEVLGGKAAEFGWLEVKRQIDQGELNATWKRSFEILDEMAQVNREEALDWFVSLNQGEEVSREERIRWAAAPGGAFEIPLPPSGDPFARDTRYDRESARSWLDEMEVQGEPVRDARMTQICNAIRDHDWKEVRRDREYLSVTEWKNFEDSVVAAAVSMKSESVRGEEIAWASVNERSLWLEAAREFALLERVETLTEERNHEARAQLRAIVEKVDEEAGR